MKTNRMELGCNELNQVNGGIIEASRNGDIVTYIVYTDDAEKKALQTYTGPMKYAWAFCSDAQKFARFVGVKDKVINPATAAA